MEDMEDMKSSTEVMEAPTLETFTEAFVEASLEASMNDMEDMKASTKVTSVKAPMCGSTVAPPTFL